ncbi:MAG: hypothetical protein CAK90_03000 [Spartobacteria bacterium AMD-G4]|nr:MAG: hypothetical protein CAK90_03000 [Spartobacteria bacterium AMD-G4]
MNTSNIARDRSAPAEIRAQSLRKKTFRATAHGNQALEGFFHLGQSKSVSVLASQQILKQIIPRDSLGNGPHSPSRSPDFKSRRIALLNLIGLATASGIYRTKFLPLLCMMEFAPPAMSERSW